MYSITLVYSYMNLWPNGIGLFFTTKKTWTIDCQTIVLSTGLTSGDICWRRRWGPWPGPWDLEKIYNTWAPVR